MLEMEKTKAISRVFKFKRLIGEVEETLAQKRKVHRKLAAEEKQSFAQIGNPMSNMPSPVFIEE